MEKRAKRANGEGSIKLRKDGRWEVRITDINKKLKYLYAKSYEEALERLEYAKQQIKELVELPSPRAITVEKWFNYWLKTYGVIAYKNTTYSSYHDLIRAYIIPRIGKIILSELRLRDVQKMFNDLYCKGNKRSKKGLAAATLLKIKNVLSKGLLQARLEEIIKGDPIKGLVLPPIETPLIKTFTKDEKAMLYTQLADYDIGLAIAFLLNTGLRIGELLALEKSDINFIEKTIAVTKNVSFIKNKSTHKLQFVVSTPKTKSGIRIINMLPHTERLLLMQINHIEDIKVKAKYAWKENNLLFPACDGGYQSQSNMRKKFIRLQKNAGIINTKTLHSLRHTFATDALNTGISAQNLAGILGHKNGAITLEFYGHYNSDEAYRQLITLDKMNSDFGQFEYSEIT